MAERKNWFSARMAAGGSAEVFIYDEIGIFGVTAAGFVAQVRALNAKALTVRLNSPGGSIPDGMAIYNFLRAESARGVPVHVEVDGWAASIASVIMLAGDTVAIGEGGFVMIHNPTVPAGGSAEDLRRAADDLDKFRASIVAVYGRETGQPRKNIEAWMNAETWFTAEEAVAKGFADEVSARAKAAACAAPRSMTFRHAPTAGVRTATINTEEPDMNEIAKLLGLPEGASLEDILAAIKKLQGVSTPGTPGTVDPGEGGTPQNIAAIVAERDALRKTIAEVRADAAEVIVQGAIDAGKIKATAKDAFVRAYKADAKSAKALLDGIEVTRPSMPPRNGHAPLPVPRNRSGDPLFDINLTERCLSARGL
jgi:ATP-dependent protease ClpP protease subunit